jgi:hypothetical protein
MSGVGRVTVSERKSIRGREVVSVGIAISGINKKRVKQAAQLMAEKAKVALEIACLAVAPTHSHAAKCLMGLHFQDEIPTFALRFVSPRL